MVVVHFNACYPLFSPTEIFLFTFAVFLMRVFLSVLNVFVRVAQSWMNSILRNHHCGNLPQSDSTCSHRYKRYKRSVWFTEFSVLQETHQVRCSLIRRHLSPYFRNLLRSLTPLCEKKDHLNKMFLLTNWLRTRSSTIKEIGIHVCQQKIWTDLCMSAYNDHMLEASHGIV